MAQSKVGVVTVRKVQQGTKLQDSLMMVWRGRKEAAEHGDWRMTEMPEETEFSLAPKVGIKWLTNRRVTFSVDGGRVVCGSKTSTRKTAAHTGASRPSSKGHP